MAILVTGATGLVGGGATRRLLENDLTAHVFALVRQPAVWAEQAAKLGPLAGRVTPVFGDVTEPGLGLDRATRNQLRRCVRAVVHSAADTTFSRPLDVARAVNREGTRHVIELAQECALDRFVHVSTAFVAGRRTGRIDEGEADGEAGFVNGYEQSKYEAELIVRASSLPWAILRPSTIICDDASGAVSQINAAHRALRIFHGGLAALVPGDHATPIDMVTNEFVVDGVVRIGFAPDAVQRTFHLCAGADSIALGDLLNRAHAIWSRDTQWRRRGIVLPALTDLDTYRLFERSVDETGDTRLAGITRSLSHFVPQLALPKHFMTTGAESILGYAAPPVSSYWDRMVEQLLITRWSPSTGIRGNAA